MTSVYENAMTILSLMHDMGIVLGYGKPMNEIAKLTNLSRQDFDKAGTFLLQSNYIDGAGSDEKGRRWITPKGIEHINRSTPASLSNEYKGVKTMIFISYRRADSISISGRIFDRLELLYGRDNVFKDVDNIPPGVDFRDFINEAIQDCDVMLVIIGQTWLSITGATGIRRLDEPDDPVRIEVETGFNNRVHIVPVLVSDAQMPKESELPHTISSLAYLNAVSVREDPDFRRDMDRLIAGLDSKIAPNVQTASIDTFRGLLNSSNQENEVRRLFRHEVEQAYQRLRDVEFTSEIDNMISKGDEFENIVEAYFAPVENVLFMASYLCSSREPRWSALIVEAIQRWSENIEIKHYHSYYFPEYIPVLLLVYVYGIISVDNNIWNNLPQILIEPKIRLPNRYENKNFIEILTRDILLRFAQNFHLERNEINDSILDTLEQVLLDQMASNSVLEKNFDLFEVLFALIYLDAKEDNWMFVHKAIDDDRAWQSIEYFWEQGGRQSSQWSLLDAGLFNNTSHLLELLTHYRQIAVRHRSKYLIPTAIPDFAAAYERGLAKS